MTKKITYLLVLLILALVFAACGGGDDAPAAPEAPAAAEEADAEPETEPEPPPEPEVEEPEAEPVEPPPEEEVAQEEAVTVQPPPMDDPELMPVEQFEMFVDDLPVEGWGKTIVAGAALDLTEGPSNNGFPPFIFIDFSSPGDAVIPDPKAIFTFDVPQGRVFAVAPYLDMYVEGGRDYAQEAVSGLQQILDERPETLDDKLLTLPGFGDAQQGVRGTPTYVDFDGGSGVGFVAGYGQEIGPLLNDTLVYQFVGLTETHSDTPFGTQYISFVFPLEANFLSDLESVTDDEVAEAEADLDAYLAGKTEEINNAADTDFTPNLSAINTAMQSITIGPEEAAEPAEETTEEEAAGGEAVVIQPPPMDDPELMTVEQFEMFVDDLPVEGWGKTMAAGATLDQATGPSNNGFPPFIFVDFSSPGDDVFPDPKAIFTMDVPQGRVFAVAPYLAMYQEGGSDYAQEAVSSLQQILDERPTTLDEKLLTLPGFGDAQQGVRGEPTYIDFDGGSGVGFVSGYGQEIGPLLNDTLVYQFVGLTETHSDTPFGTQYISFVFPLEANFLADLESVSDEEIAEAEADLESYLAGKTEQINNAAGSDITPNLSAIIAAMQTITVNAEE